MMLTEVILFALLLGYLAVSAAIEGRVWDFARPDVKRDAVKTGQYHGYRILEGLFVFAIPFFAVPWDMVPWDTVVIAALIGFPVHELILGLMWGERNWFPEYPWTLPGGLKIKVRWWYWVVEFAGGVLWLSLKLGGVL